MKHINFFENFSNNQNKKDIEYVIEYFNENISNYDIKNISLDNNKTNELIKKIITKHNSFWRGSKNIAYVDKVPPKDYNYISLSGIEELTENGKYGLIFTTTSKEEAKTYGKPYLVSRILDFSGRRKDWITNNKFNPYDCSFINTEEQYKEFMLYLKENKNAILKVKRDDDIYKSTHYIFRGLHGEKIFNINETLKTI
jgi:hypothetical protein